MTKREELPNPFSNDPWLSDGDSVKGLPKLEPPALEEIPLASVPQWTQAEYLSRLGSVWFSFSFACL